MVCVNCACAVFSTSRHFYSIQSEKLLTKKKHRPPLPPSISEQFYVLSVVHFEWMWLIFSSFGNFVVSFCRIFQNYPFGLPYFVLIKYTCHLFFKSANNLFYFFTECLFDFYGNYIESLLGVYVVCTLRSIY